MDLVLRLDLVLPPLGYLVLPGTARQGKWAAGQCSPSLSGARELEGSYSQRRITRAKARRRTAERPRVAGTPIRWATQGPAREPSSSAAFSARLYQARWAGRSPSGIFSNK